MNTGDVNNYVPDQGLEAIKQALVDYDSFVKEKRITDPVLVKAGMEALVSNIGQLHGDIPLPGTQDIREIRPARFVAGS